MLSIKTEMKNKTERGQMACILNTMDGFKMGRDSKEPAISTISKNGRSVVLEHSPSAIPRIHDINLSWSVRR